MKLDIYVNYPGHCEEAFRFYEQHLKGKITGIADVFGLHELAVEDHPRADAGPQRQEDQTVEFAAAADPKLSIGCSVGVVVDRNGETQPGVQCGAQLLAW